MPFDGIGRTVRNGLNFTERGFGIRGAVGTIRPGPHRSVADEARRHRLGRHLSASAVSRWFHTGGIFAALSETTARRCHRGSQGAKSTAPSSQLRSELSPVALEIHRRSKKAQEVNQEIAKYVDVMIGNEEDFTACLGFEVEGVDENLSNIDVETFKHMIAKAVAAYPNFKTVATTLRTVKTATIN